jgi:heme-degrading monooxygenase HmoA
MIMRITWGKVQPGQWEAFERAYRANVVAKGSNIKGLQGRWLVRETADRDAGYSVSLWNSPEDMQTYEQSDLYRQIVSPLQPFFIGDFTTHTCEVRHVEDARLKGLH